MTSRDPDDEPDLAPESIAQRLVRVREVPDEATATMLADFLRDQGVKAAVQPVQIPWMYGVETMRHGYWGWIEVLERDAVRARALIEDFFAARHESADVPGSDDEPEPEGAA